MKELSANEITKMAISYLNATGHYVWRQNNHHTPGRKFIGMKGLPDIIGYCKRSGISVFCEVKKNGDKLSEDQISFLTLAEQNGCQVYIAHELNGQAELTKWSQYNDKG